MEICKYNFLFTIIVLNSVALMYLEFNGASLVIQLFDNEEIEIKNSNKVEMWY